MHTSLLEIRHQNEDIIFFHMWLDFHLERYNISPIIPKRCYPLLLVTFLLITTIFLVMVQQRVISGRCKGLWLHNMVFGFSTDKVSDYIKVWVRQFDADRGWFISVSQLFVVNV